MKTRLTSLILPALQLCMQACWLGTWLYVLEIRLLQHCSLMPVALLFAAAAMPMRLYMERLAVKPVLRVAAFWLAWVALAAIVGKLMLLPTASWIDISWTYALPRAIVRLPWETRTAELLLLFGSGGAWYAGGRAAEQQVTYETLLAQFQFGLILLFVAFLVAHALEVPASHPALLSVTFFSASLAALAITRNRIKSERPSLPRGRHFTGPLVALLIVVATLGLIAGVAITPNLVGMVLDGIRAVGRAIVAGLMFLLSLLPAPDMPSGGEMDAPATGDDSALTTFYRSLPWPAILRRILFILWLAAILGMALLSLWRLCSMILDWLKRRGDASGVQIESLESGLLADLLALLFWIDRTMNRLLNRVASFIRRRLGPVAEPTWTSIYIGLTRWAARKVLPRQPWQSVHEYQALLVEHMPDAIDELAYVTETYALARYGGLEPECATVQEMQRAATRIRKTPRARVTRAQINKTEGEE